MSTGVSILLVVILGLTASGLGVGVLIGWLAREAARGPAPYHIPTTPEALAYGVSRGLKRGAPIPSRRYWRAVERGEITPEPWVKTPAEMGSVGR